jgi:tetratricopeptide (TPR) repeat protein
MVAYVTKEGDKFLLRAFDSDESLGEAALLFADRGEIDRARVWLNWARENVWNGDGDDPLMRPPFAMVWPKAKQTATAEEVRLAAAMQIAGHTDEKLDLLLKLRESAASDAIRTAIDVALVSAYSEHDRDAEALPVARRLHASHPDSTSAFYSLVSALYNTGHYDEATAMAKKRLERVPNDADALRLLAHIAAAKADYTAAETWAQQLIDNTTPIRNDFNNAAWYGLLTGNLERAAKNALQATDDKDEAARDSAALHTLASIYAESDKPLQAREALLSSMDQGGREQPDADDWYVLGRIAETYGVREAAISAYKRVPKAKEKDWNQEIAELVARRVAKLK